MKENITLKPIDVRQATITIEGTTILVQNQFSEKSKKALRDTKSGKKTKNREPCNPQQEFEDATYKTENEKYGIPEIAIRKAIIGAAHKNLGIEKTLVCKSLFINCMDKDGILEMKTEDPIMREDYVRVGNGGTDLRYRPEFKKWECDVPIEYNATNLTIDVIVNLLNSAGFGVGLCEFRPEKKGKWGRFKVKTTA